MADKRSTFVLYRLEKRQPGHRVEHAFAELVGHPVVQPHHRDSERRQFQPQPRVELCRTVETADRAADTQHGAARSFSRVHDYRDLATRGAQLELARAVNLVTL